MYKLWVGISTIAAVLQRKCVLRWGTLSFYPNMYIVLVGPPGKCRKGTAMNTGYNLLKDLGVKLSAEAITREALIRELAQTTDTVVDPQTGIVHMHSSLSVVSPELTVFLGYNNQQLMMDLTDWFDCRDYWTYRTKNSGTDEIIGVFVNLIGATTPGLLQSTLPMNAIGGGLTSRMIFVYETEKSRSIATPFHGPTEKALAPMLKHDLERIHMLSGEFKVSDPFINRYIDWYMHFDSQQHILTDQRFAAYFERKPTHLMKLCMILNASRTNSQMVEVEDFDRAIALLDKTEENMQYTFMGVGRNVASETMQEVLDFLEKHRRVSMAVLTRMFFRDADARQLENILQTMENMKSIRRIYSGQDIFVEFLKFDRRLYQDGTAFDTGTGDRPDGKDD